ncbi:hypothetical protein [Microbacterium sp. NPDC056052]|uniref:hypothetical protein n=1 Tax=Microbacterium sp. NPDC056052 TaxID=3345695 RepID=UPI0035D57984
MNVGLARVLGAERSPVKEGRPSMFVIEDELHAEQIGTYSQREEAMAALLRFATLPWDERPNAAPCRSWRSCGRSYELVEYDTTDMPWREVSREAMLEISKGDVRWH